MGKPEDIPADVFEVGVSIARDLPYRVGPHSRDFAAITIARAILAERERCAKAADDVADAIAAIPTPTPETRLVSDVQVEVLRTVAKAIRNGGE